jgi:hypothetical protein
LVSKTRSQKGLSLPNLMSFPGAFGGMSSLITIRDFPGCSGLSRTQPLVRLSLTMASAVAFIGMRRKAIPGSPSLVVKGLGSGTGSTELT